MLAWQSVDMSHLIDALVDGQPERMSARQVGEVLGVSERTVLRWLQAGDFPGIRLPGGGWMILREELRAWLHSAHNMRGTEGPQGDARE